MRFILRALLIRLLIRSCGRGHLLSKRIISKVKDNHDAHSSVARAAPSLQSSSHPFIHTLADCVRAICRDRELLCVLGGHLGALSSEELARAVVTAAASHHDDGNEVIKISDLWILCLISCIHIVVIYTIYIRNLFYYFVNYRVIIMLIRMRSMADLNVFL